MTNRTFAAEELVPLPRLNAAETIIMATALVARAEAAGELPAAIARELGRMRQRLGAMRDSTQTRVQERGESDSKDAWNRALDGAWAAMRWWCKGWSLVPHADYAAMAESARKIESMVFPDGLRFTQLPYREQWVESQARLGLIDKEPALGQAFTLLGGQVLVDAVRKAHDEFGHALGFTNAPEAPPSTSIVRDGREELKASMRRYIMQVAAHADPDDPAATALSDDLLLPVTTWKTRTTASSETGEDDAGPPADDTDA